MHGGKSMHNSFLEKPHQRNEGQDKLLELLKKFDERCEEFNITYYLGVGTALGAIRHKGFLPWDDDVDLYITRREYQKLCSVQKAFFSDDFVLANNENFSRYRNPYARCIDTSSTAVTLTRLADDAPKGQFLELFILDPIPTDAEEKNSWLTLFLIYCELLCFTYRNASEKNGKWIDFDLYDKYLKRCDKIGREQVLHELEETLFSIEEENAEDYILSWGGEFFIYPIQAFGKPRRVEFEKTLLPVASKAENIFRIAFGDDWAIIPQNENQIQHNVKLDMNHSYLEYMESEDEFENLWPLYPERKRAALAMFHSEMDLVKMFQMRMTNSLKHYFESKNAISVLMELEREEKYNEMLEILNPWLDAQFSDLFRRWNRYLDVGDEYLERILFALLSTGDFKRFSKILDLTKDLKQAESSRISEYRAFAAAIRNANAYMDVKDFQSAKKELECAAMYGYAVDQECYRLADIRWCVETHEVQDLSALLQRVINLQDEYPQQSDFVFYRGRVEYLLGDTDSAMKHLEEFYKNSRNGMMRLAIREMIEEDGEIA